MSERLEQLRAWLDRPCPAPERDTEVANRPPEEWPPLERPVPREHLGADAIVFEYGEFCLNPTCWCAEMESGRLMIVVDGRLVPQVIDEQLEAGHA